MLSSTTPAIYAIKLLEELNCLGLKPDAHRQRAGISASDLEDPMQPIAMARYQALVEGATLDPGAPPDLGFRIGEHTRTVEHGSIGYAILNSVDLRQCLDRYRRFLPLTGPVLKFATVDDPNHASLIAEPLASYSLPAYRYFVQEWLASCTMWGAAHRPRVRAVHRGTRRLSEPRLRWDVRRPSRLPRGICASCY